VKIFEYCKTGDDVCRAPAKTAEQAKSKPAP